MCDVAAIAQLNTSGSLLSLAICNDLRTRCSSSLLCDEQPTELEKLIRLSAGELIGRLDGLHLPLCARGLRL